MANRRLIEIDGKEKTLTEWAKFYNRSFPMVYQRISRGWDAKEALTTPKGFTGVMITANGETRSYDNWAKKIGISRSQVFRRIKKTKNIDEIIAPRAWSTKGVAAFGRTQSIRKWAKEYKLSYTCLRNRLQQGFSPERALTMPLPGNK